MTQLPSSKPQPISTANLVFLPMYVQQKVLEAAEKITDEESDAEFVYEERAATIEYVEKVASVTLQVGNLDVAPRWLHLGGSSCWMEPDYHSVYFEPIARELLPQVPDSQTWWLIYSDGGSPIVYVRKIMLAGPEAPSWDL